MLKVPDGDWVAARHVEWRRIGGGCGEENGKWKSRTWALLALRKKNLSTQTIKWCVCIIGNMALAGKDITFTHGITYPLANQGQAL